MQYGVSSNTSLDEYSASSTRVKACNKGYTQKWWVYLSKDNSTYYIQSYSSCQALIYNASNTKYPGSATQVNTQPMNATNDYYQHWVIDPALGNSKTLPYPHLIKYAHLANMSIILVADNFANVYPGLRNSPDASAYSWFFSLA